MKKTPVPGILFLQGSFLKNGLIALFAIFFTDVSFGQNLIVNGDFESGGSGTGFTSNYNLTSGPNSNSQQYAIVSNPSAINIR